MMHDAPHAWTLAAKGPMTKHKGVYVCEEDLHKVCTSSQHCDPPPATHACVSASRWLYQSVCVCLTLCVLLRAKTTHGQRGCAANSRYCMSYLMPIAPLLPAVPV